MINLPSDRYISVCFDFSIDLRQAVLESLFCLVAAGRQESGSGT